MNILLLCHYNLHIHKRRTSRILHARNHGVSQKEMAAVITHTDFYAGWPHALAVFNIAKEVYSAPTKEE